MTENEIKRDEFTEMSMGVIFALNGLMQTREVCKHGKAVTKINRFKAWVMELQDTISKEQGANPEHQTINFNPSDCPEEI